jgi:membrane associated rhomboid family serine protease
VRRGTTVAGAAPGVRPLVVPTLVALNVLAFVVTAAQAGSIAANTRSQLFAAWALSPGTVADGEWWRLFTSGFLHIGPLHIVFNMFALWVIGRDMEALLGRGRFLAVYLLGKLGGAAAVMLLYGPDDYVAGASGAVFGLMGGLVVALVRLRRPLNQVFGLLAVNLALGFFVSGISWQAHLGGLLAGAAATAVLVYAPPARRTQVQAGGLAAIAVVLLVLVTAGAVLAGS